MNVYFLPIWISIFSTLIFPSIFEVIKKRINKLDNINRINEFEKISQHFTEDFKKNFVVPEIEQQYFFECTGIKTNAKSIPIYIDLYKKLGGNINWLTIKKVTQFLIIEDIAIKIKIDRSDKFLLFFILAFCLSFYLFGFWIATNIKNLNNTHDKIIAIIFSIIFMSTALFVFTKYPKSYLMAKSIQRKLKALP